MILIWHDCIQRTRNVLAAWPQLHCDFALVCPLQQGSRYRQMTYPRRLPCHSGFEGTLSQMLVRAGGMDKQHRPEA